VYRTSITGRGRRGGPGRFRRRAAVPGPVDHPTIALPAAIRFRRIHIQRFRAGGSYARRGL